VQRIDQSATLDQEKVYYQRLFRLGEHLLDKMEQFYTRQTLPGPNLPATDESTPNQMLATRLQTLLHTALQVADYCQARKCD